MEFITFAAVFSIIYSKHERYDGWKSFYVGPSNKAQMTALMSLSPSLELDFLRQPLLMKYNNEVVHSDGVVLVKPRYQRQFVKNLRKLQIKHKIHTHNVKTQLDLDDKNIKTWMRQSAIRHGGHAMPYDSYQRMKVINAYMDQIAKNHPKHCTLVTAGDSFEKRPIKYMKISTTNFQNKKKPIIFIEAGIHAREWIAPPTVTWAIRKLTEDVTEPELVNNFDWILMPVVNPDGYEYSFTTDRFWRKTRSYGGNKTCQGVDGNRNYDYYWNSVGTSPNPCENIYPGPNAFSEVETQYVRNILKENIPRIALYFSMHSYGSQIIHPWSDKKDLPQNIENIRLVADITVTAIKSVSSTHISNYYYGSGYNILPELVSGASMDYAHYIGVPLTYVLELPGIGGGMEGFNLPPEYIEPVCQETWAGISAAAKKAGQLHRKKNKIV